VIEHEPARSAGSCCAADRPVLILVTCGGPYTPGVGYRDNVLIYARAV